MSRMEQCRYLFSEAVERDWAMLQCDIEQAFPTADLPEPVWMEIPDFIVKEHPELEGHYAYVTKALYGLCHSPRAFNKHLDEWPHKQGYESSDEDPCLYQKFSYTDDIDENGNKIRKRTELLAAIATWVDDKIQQNDIYQKPEKSCRISVILLI